MKPLVLLYGPPAAGKRTLGRELVRRTAGLPLPTTLALEVPPVDGLVTVATHAGCAPATFGLDEWHAMVAAAEAERAGPEDFAGWVHRKRTDPRFRLSPSEAAGPVLDSHPRGWTVGAVLQRLGATLRAVAIEGGGDTEPGGR